MSGMERWRLELESTVVPEDFHQEAQDPPKSTSISASENYSNSVLPVGMEHTPDNTLLQKFSSTAGCILIPSMSGFVNNLVHKANPAKVTSKIEGLHHIMPATSSEAPAKRQRTDRKPSPSRTPPRCIPCIRNSHSPCGVDDKSSYHEACNHCRSAGDDCVVPSVEISPSAQMPGHMPSTTDTSRDSPPPLCTPCMEIGIPKCNIDIKTDYHQACFRCRLEGLDCVSASACS